MAFQFKQLVVKSISKNDAPWMEKHRPDKREDFVLTEQIESLFDTVKNTNNIPHLLFHGCPGTGKTTTIRALAKLLFGREVATRTIEYNASVDRGISVVREQIAKEASKYMCPITLADGTNIPGFKLIILDESDYMTTEAQEALRVLIEQYSDVTRFCFICNRRDKLIPPIYSRCTEIKFNKLPNNVIAEMLRKICVKENMNLSSKTIDQIVQLCNGDMRKGINAIQELHYEVSAIDLLNTNYDDMTKNQLITVTKLVLDNQMNTDNETVKSIVSGKEIDIPTSCIYEAFGILPEDKLIQVYNLILSCKSVLDAKNISQTIHGSGYPIDDILLRINERLISDDTVDYDRKIRILTDSNNIFQMLNDGADEYIQLLCYVSMFRNI